jgi:hypothetical protein
MRTHQMGRRSWPTLPRERRQSAARHSRAPPPLQRARDIAPAGGARHVTHGTRRSAPAHLQASKSGAPPPRQHPHHRRAHHLRAPPSKGAQTRPPNHPPWTSQTTRSLGFWHVTLVQESVKSCGVCTYTRGWCKHVHTHYVVWRCAKTSSTLGSAKIKGP